MCASCLIIGIGNADRGDDAAGLLVARRLSELGFPAVEQPGEAVALMDLWSQARHVILVDAVATGAEPGTTFFWDARIQRLPREAFRCSTHHFGLAGAVELARMLDRLPPVIEIHGIEGARFEIGAPVTAAVAEAVERVAGAIADHLWHERALLHSSG